MIYILELISQVRNLYSTGTSRLARIFHDIDQNYCLNSACFLNLKYILNTSEIFLQTKSEEVHNYLILV
jgi:hypothetical protein